MRVQEGDEGPAEVGTLDAVRVRVMTLGEGADVEMVRVELLSEMDLFFVYAHSVRAAEYAEIQEEQRLMVSFQDYPGVLCRSLNNVITKPHSHLAVLVMHPDGHARLDFIENMEFKFVELLSVNFMRCPDDVIREQVSYRYNTLKAQKALLAARLQDVQRLIQAKNPSLLLQLQRAAGPAASASGGASGVAPSAGLSASASGSPPASSSGVATRRP
jgi:Centriolar protein SAS N-terminal